MQVLSGIAETLPTGLYADIARYRHMVFVERLGWELQIPRQGEELDQFDRPDTVYVIAKNDTGHIQGCARLLPTTRPYLLGDIFPQLLNGQSAPCSPDIWELSRFSATLFHNGPSPNYVGQLSSPIAVRLLRESIACASERGAKRLITVSPIGIERLLRRAGFHAHRAGPPMVIGGHPICACWIEVRI